MYKSILWLIAWFLLLGCYSPDENNAQDNAKLGNKFACYNFQSTCQIKLGDSVFNVEFDQEQLNPETPFNVKISPIASKDELPKLNGYIEGVNMYMGKIPLMFEIKGNAYIANSVFGSCSEEKMIWRINIAIANDLNKVSRTSFEVTSFLPQ